MTRMMSPQPRQGIMLLCFSMANKNNWLPQCWQSLILLASFSRMWSYMCPPRLVLPFELFTISCFWLPCFSLILCHGAPFGHGPDLCKPTLIPSVLVAVSLANNLLFIVCHLLFIICCLSFIIHHLSFVVHHSSFIIRCSLFIICHSSFVIHHLSFPTIPTILTIIFIFHCSLFILHHL